MADQEGTQNSDEKKKGKGCLGWLWRISLIGLVLLAAFLLWFNGPGVRWLGPKIGKHFLEKAKIEGGFELEGTLAGGIGVRDLSLSSHTGAIKKIEVSSLQTDYRLSEVIKGEIRGISGEDIVVEVRLIEKEQEEKPPFDFANLGKILRDVRKRVVPVAIDLDNVSFSAEKEGKPVIELGETDLSHEAGADKISLSLGEIVIAGDRELASQEVSILWTEERLTLDRIELLPILSVANLEVDLPPNGEVAARADIRVADALLKLDVGAGIKDLRLDLVEGELNFANVMEGLGVEIPVTGRLTSLAVGVTEFFPVWQTAVGSAEILVENVNYDGWQAPEIALGLTLDEGDINLKLTGEALGTNLEVAGGGQFERAKLDTEGLVMEEVGGTISISSVDRLLRGLDAKQDLGVDVSKFPESSLAGSWSVALDEMKFAGVVADIALNAKDPEIVPILLEAGFAGDVVEIISLETKGMVSTGKYDLKAKTYEGTETLSEFNSADLEPWMTGLGLQTPGSGVFSMEWKGGGDLAAKTHFGELSDFSGYWTWKESEEGTIREPISASGNIAYEWPGSVKINELVVETQGQRIELDADLVEDRLTLEKLVWSEGETEFLEGSGVLPVPEDFSKWKEFLANDTRPLDLEIDSRELELRKLSPWLSGVDKIDPKATGEVGLSLTGSLAAPEMQLALSLKDVALVDKPEIPPVDLTLEMIAKDGIANVRAEAVTPDFAPAVLNAEMGFLPKKWAENPELIKEAEISGKLALPNVDVSRFTALLPEGTELAGTVNGSATLDGTVGEPAVNGKVTYTGGRFSMNSESVPALVGISLEIDADLDSVKLSGGVSDMEGGSASIEGNLKLKNPEGEGLGPFELNINATAVPGLRNDFLLLRANASLKLAGTLDEANLTGEIGVIDSVFYKDIELIPIGAPFLEPSAASLPKIDTPSNPGTLVPAPFDKWTANVVVKTIDPIMIRGNIGTGKVEAALRIEGTLGDPKPNGEVRLSEVVAKLPFTTLEVRKGTLTFTPATGFDPILEIRGSAEPRPYRVSAYAYGKLSDPQLVLTSEPPLPENEIMTLLATGTTTDGLEDTQAASNRAMQLLIEEVRRGRFLFGKQLRPALKLLDNVDFSLAESDPYDSDSYSSATIKLSDQWYVSAGLGAQGDQRALAIWRFGFK